MKGLIRAAVDQTLQPAFKRLVLAEWLQHLILQSLYHQGAFGALVFTGGTALRIVYQTGRYSEDLDFSLVKKDGFRFQNLLQKIRKDFELLELPFEIHSHQEKTVLKADLRFPGLLQEFRLSPLRDQKLTIKLEIDRNPPRGGRAEPALVAQPISYSVTIFDLPSLFANKLLAIFLRPYTKGRDYYDLVWFLGKRVQPNFKVLNNGFGQAKKKGFAIGPEDFKQRLTDHLDRVDFTQIRKELERFLIHSDELKGIDRAAVQSLLRHYE